MTQERPVKGDQASGEEARGMGPAAERAALHA
jgi:hypothetical protein